MPTVEVRVPSNLKQAHNDARQILASLVRMQSLELACERLMALTQKDLKGNELKSALEAYSELKDSIQEHNEMLDRVQLMLKVVGQNLMEAQLDEVPSA